METIETATTDGLEILHREFYEGQPERIASLEQARASDATARKIQKLRAKAELTQTQLLKPSGSAVDAFAATGGLIRPVASGKAIVKGMEIQFTTQIFKEGRTFIAYTRELDLSSCGHTEAKATSNLLEAVRIFLDEADRMGTLSRILEQSGYLNCGDAQLQASFRSRTAES